MNIRHLSIGLTVLFAALATTPAASQVPTAYLKKKKLKIRFSAVDKGSGVVRAELWMSADKGANWRMVRVMDKVQDRIRTKPGKRPFFIYTTQGDGEFWFIIRSADKVNHWSVESPKKNARAMRKVVIDSTPPLLKVTEPTDGKQITGGKNLYVDWQMHDLNPRAMPVRIDYRLSKSGPWKVLGSKLPYKGPIPLPLPFANHPDATIRVTATDRLGNKTTIARKFSILTVPAGEQMPKKEKTKPIVLKRPKNPRKRKGVVNPGRRVLELCARARTLLEEARYERALASYKEALRLQPRYVAAIFDAGICHYYLRRYPEAWKQFDLAISMDPENPGLYLRRGHAYFQRGMFPGALKDLQKGVSLAGDDQRLQIQCLDLMAEIYRSRQAFAEAIKAWNRITQLGDGQQALVKSARNNLKRYRNRVKK